MDHEMNIRTESKWGCLLCGGGGHRLYKDLTDAYCGTPGLWSFDKCTNPNCGLIWLNPAPIVEDLPLVYGGYFIQSGVSWLRSLLLRIYSALNFIPQTWAGIGMEKARMEFMFLGDVEPGMLLDVGCGDGGFLNKMRGQGWEGEGIDFDEKAVANANKRYGRGFYWGSIHSMEYPDEHFDAVTSSHVVEHVPNPVAWLKEIWRITKPGGRIVLTTPNSASLGHKKFKEHWLAIQTPRHLHIYDLDSFSRLLRLAGVKPRIVRSTAANADTFFGASYSIRDSVSHKTNFAPRFSVMRTVKSILYHYYEQEKVRNGKDCGEEIICIIDKPK